MVKTKITLEEQFFILMRRLRSLALDDHPEGNETVSPARMALLDTIAGMPGCGVGDIAAELDLTPPTVSVGIHRLEESGFVERKPDPQDGRSIRLFLTRRGQALQRQIRSKHLKKFRLLLSGLPPEEQQELLDLLQRALNAAEAKVTNQGD